MDHKFTEKIGEWLKTANSERDYTVGALYLLKLSGNQILYRNIIVDVNRHRETIDYQLQKYYNFRVAALTHAQVAEMSAKVEKIASDRKLESAEEPEEKRAVGRRADHDSLPLDVQAAFVENLSILRRMREVHLKLRSLSLDNATCPDSERYPFLKELISLDKKMGKNWELYDTYTPSTSKAKKRKK